MEELQQASRESVTSRFPWLHLAAVVVGVLVVLLVSGSRSSGALRHENSHQFSHRQTSGVLPVSLSDRDLDRRQPQEQAKILLERAISGTDRSPAQTEAEIEARLDRWQGKLYWDAELGRLITAALNSEDRAVRTSAIEVQLAAYGLAQNDSSVDALVRQANSSNHAQKVWALWALGLLGNRGVETDRVVQVLTSHLNDPKDPGKELDRDTNTASTKERREANDNDDEDSRVWAIEGLALVRKNSTIAPLLDAMRNDPSKVVRERAAYSLAESGMLSREQRLTAVPQLINDSDDPKPGLTNPRLGVPGSCRHHKATSTERFGGLARLVSKIRGEWPVMGGWLKPSPVTQPLAANCQLRSANTATPPS